MRIALAFVVLALAGCSQPDRPILRGALDLPVAAGDTWKLCADDGVDDTTPDADCVLGREEDPAAAYRDALTAGGWSRVDGGPARVEIWMQRPDAAGDCRLLTLTGEKVRFAAKARTLLRFELSQGACP